MTAECQNVRERLDAFVDRELDPQDSAEVSRHIANCPECVQELNTIRTVRSRLRTAVLNQPVPDGLGRRVGIALRENQPLRGSPAWRWAPLAIAAMLVLAFGLSWNAYRTWADPHATRTAADRYTESLQGRLATVLRVAMTDHIHCGVFRRYPSNPPPREQMVSDMGLQYKDLIPIVRARVPDRYRLEQAHRCTSSGREYVHMIFRDRSALISLIATIRRPGESLAEVPAAGGTPVIRTGGVDQYQVAAFDAGPFLAYVVSDMPRSENLTMAFALATPVSSFLGGVNPVRVF
jgi:anti-sigma factor (TIGR02949 family)